MKRETGIDAVVTLNKDENTEDFLSGLKTGEWGNIVTVDRITTETIATDDGYVTSSLNFDDERTLGVQRRVALPVAEVVLRHAPGVEADGRGGRPGQADRVRAPGERRPGQHVGRGGGRQHGAHDPEEREAHALSVGGRASSATA